MGGKLSLLGYFFSGDSAEKTDKTSISDRRANQMQESTLVGLQRLLKAHLQMDISIDGVPDPSKGVERPRISQE